LNSGIGKISGAYNGVIAGQQAAETGSSSRFPAEAGVPRAKVNCSPYGDFTDMNGI
jgi:hypothetical protein